MARKEKKLQEWPAWRYGPQGQSAIFDHPKDVPDDWVSEPLTDDYVPAKARLLKGDELRAALKAKGIKIDPFWPNAYMEILNDGTPSR